MNTIVNKNIIRFFLALTLACLAFSCSRDEEGLEPATYPVNPDVFLDAFSGLEYQPFDGSYLSAFSVDSETKYSGTVSIRLDIPNAGDPLGEYAGASFIDQFGRDLSSFDVLTFWAKGSQAGVIDEIGFGNDFGQNLHTVTLPNLQLTTNWRKYTIPIPNAARLKREKGLLWYSASPEGGKGYSLWVDEVKFEKLEDIGQPRPRISGGQNLEIASFNGFEVAVADLDATYTLPSGEERTVSCAPGYFDFLSSDPNVAAVDANGKIRVIGAGTATITASLKGVQAAGSITINSLGDFRFAPVPDRDPADVISIFSDAYGNIPVDYYNGFWQFSTTLGGNELEINNDQIITYTNLNFVGIQFATTVPTVDISQMTHLHVDIFTPELLGPDDFIRIGLTDIGPDNAFGGGNDSGQEIAIRAPRLVSREWISLDIPLSDFAGLTRRNNLAQFIFVSDGTVSSLLVDNIYFYREEIVVPTEPDMAAPVPSKNPADVISLFSDAYSDIPVDTWRTDWSSAGLQDVTIAGNATKKYTNLDFVGIETVSNMIDATDMTHFHLDVWSPNFTSFGIKIVDFGAEGAFGGGDDSEHQINFQAPAQGEWISYDIPLSDFTGLTGKGHLAQFILVGQPSGSATVFIDNVYFYGDGSGMMGSDEPTTAAPIPAKDAANVISLFSDVYTDVTVDMWRTDWSSATLEDISIAGSAVKKYSNLDFVGIETVSNTIDASGMTHFHIDVWSSDCTLFGIKMVDFGANGAFGGGDDTEHQINFDSPAQGEWVSYDIPLSDFTGLTTKGHIAQFILVGQPTGMTTVYIDNVYFYK